jgi:two-component system NtrC family response regulator
VDVRVLAATNKNLETRVEEGQFREDLYYRLKVINIHLPPLRERKEDIPAMATHFLGKYSRTLMKEVAGFRPDALEKLCSYHWPGNVRELENEIERAVIPSDSGQIGAEDLSIRPEALEPSPEGLPMLEEMEKDLIRKVLQKTGGNQSKASQLLGINRKTLYLKLKKYGLPEPSP